MQNIAHLFFGLWVSNRANNEAYMSGVTWHELPLSDTVNDVLLQCDTVDGGLPVTVLPIPGECEVVDNYHETARIFVAQHGHGKRWSKRGLRTRSLYTAPRMIEMYEAHITFEREVWEGTQGRCVCVTFPDENVQAMTHGEVQSLALDTRHELFDDRLSGLTLEIAQESMAGFPNGSLYVQGLTTALLGLVVQNYAIGAKTPPLKTQKLSARQMHFLTELLHHNLGGELSIDWLANQLGMSPYHFARLFKASYDTTPHRYVQMARLNAAAEALLKNQSTPIAVVAVSCGFSSQSHLTHLMKRSLGVTPAELRRSHFGPK